MKTILKLIFCNIIIPSNTSMYHRVKQQTTHLYGLSAQYTPIETGCHSFETIRLTGSQDVKFETEVNYTY